MKGQRYPEAIEHYPLAVQIFIKTLDGRIKSGKNALIIVVGQTGSGKSLSTINLIIALYLYRHGEMPSVEYVTEHCFFRAKNLIQQLNETNLEPGTAWNWDEAGVDISHKTHMSLQNRVVGWLAQTFRHQQQIVFFTVPTVGFIDASIRKLLHFYLETLYIDKQKKMCIIKPLFFQYNIRQDKMYYHNLTSPGKDGFTDEIDVMPVPLAPPDYVTSYETKKSNFTRDLNLELQKMLERAEDKDKPKMTERQQHIIDLLESGVVSTNEIAEKLDCSPVTISNNFNYLRRKGINIDIFLKKRRNNGFNAKNPIATT